MANFPVSWMEVSLYGVTLRDRDALMDLHGRAGVDGPGHRRGEPSACYASEDEDTAIAEVLNAHPDLEGAPMRSSVLEGRLAIVDVSDPAVLALLDVKLDDLLAEEDFHPCQQVLATAVSLGAHAVRLPSARATGTNVIVEHFSARSNLSVVTFRIGTLTRMD